MRRVCGQGARRFLVSTWSLFVFCDQYVLIWEGKYKKEKECIPQNIILNHQLLYKPCFFFISFLMVSKLVNDGQQFEQEDLAQISTG